MIDNIILLITGTLHQRSITELLPKCHPLGSFEQMEAINIASTSAELYNAVLVDTPLAQYFLDCISEHDLDEMNIEIIRNTLYKAYLEDFYEFCMTLGDSTAEIMSEILAFEADRRAFIITINSFGTELSKEDRFKLFPRCGKLYPDGKPGQNGVEIKYQLQVTSDDDGKSGEWQGFLRLAVGKLLPGTKSATPQPRVQYLLVLDDNEGRAGRIRIEQTIGQVGGFNNYAIRGFSLK